MGNQVIVSKNNSSYYAGDTLLWPLTTEQVDNLLVFTFLEEQNENISDCEGWKWSVLVCHEKTGIILAEASDRPFIVSKDGMLSITQGWLDFHMKWIEIDGERKKGTSKQIRQLIRDKENNLRASTIKKAQEVLIKLAS